MTESNGGQSKKDPKQQSESVGDVVSIFQRGGRWYANFQHSGRQHRRSLKTTSKKEAKRLAIQLEAEITGGRYEKQVKAPTLQSVIGQYREHLAGKRRAKRTIEKYEYAFGLFEALAEKRRARNILQIDLSFVDAFRATRVRHGTQNPASAKTIHSDLVLLKQLMNFAFRRKMIAANPLRELELEKPKPRPQPCWEWEEVERILASAKEPQRSQLTLLAETGMRSGELRWLTWDDVDLRNNVIHIQPKDDWKPKTGDIRAIPISPRAREVLERLPRSHRWVVTAHESSKYPNGDHQINGRRLLEYLKRLLKRIGMPTDGKLHTFRHSLISHALINRVPEAVVRQWAGHVDRDIIRQYTHIADSASQAAMQRLAAQGNGKLHATQERVNDEREKTNGKPAQIQHTRRGGKKSVSAK